VQYLFWCQISQKVKNKILKGNVLLQYSHFSENFDKLLKTIEIFPLLLDFNFSLVAFLKLVSFLFRQAF
jgi:hypothetical protein